MKEQLEIFLTWAVENGWIVQRRQSPELQLPEHIRRRYPRLPEDYLDFLKLVDACVMPDGQAWFLCMHHFHKTLFTIEEDFNEEDGWKPEELNLAYEWNHIENISLGAAEDSHDEEFKHEVLIFWDHHFPIFLSDRSDYAYYAINVADDFGSIIFNFEPFFEDETEPLHSSFIGLLENIMKGKIEE